MTNSYGNISLLENKSVKIQLIVYHTVQIVCVMIVNIANKQLSILNTSCGFVLCEQIHSSLLDLSQTRHEKLKQTLTKYITNRFYGMSFQSNVIYIV